MTQLLQLYPNRITITPQRQPLEFHKVKFNSQCHSFSKAFQDSFHTNFSKKRNSFVLSKASKKKLLDSINTMYFLSPSRKIKMKNDKWIYNYKCSFITLTLPTQQEHTDVEIKKLCLNQFLVEIRKHYNVENYVWKAELQKNENIHFHLIIDQYIDFQALRRRWNRILNKLNYVDRYQQRMSKLSLIEYHNLRNKNNNISFSDSSKAYAKGKSNGWKNPNTVDVKSVHNKRNLATYLSKYVTKDVTKEDAENIDECRQAAFGRSWYRSYSLSAIKYRNKFLADEMKTLISYLESKKEKVLKITGDYFTAFYFAAEELDKSFRAFHKKFIVANAVMYNYPFPNTT